MFVHVVPISSRKNEPLIYGKGYDYFDYKKASINAKSDSFPKENVIAKEIWNKE